MKDHQECENCIFWKQERNDKMQGQCRRFPPMLISAILTENTRLTGDSALNPHNIISASQHPMTLGFHLCGEWRPKP
jgi:hypothetical protein